MTSIEKILKGTGLSVNETRLFLAAVKTGAAPVSKIATEAGIARTYAYELAEELEKKGLLSEITEEPGVKKVVALDYEGLLAYIGRRQKEMERLEKNFLKVEGQFRALQTGFPQKTKVRFFEGIEGIKSINAEIRRDLAKLAKPYNFYVVFSADRMEAVLPGWIEHNQHIYYEPWMRKYLIISETKLLDRFLEQVKKAGQKNFHAKIWPEEQREFPTDTLCWQNKIAILDMTGHPSGIIIENQAIVDTFIMWFRQIWESLR